MGQITIIALLAGSLMAIPDANAQIAGDPITGSRASDAATGFSGNGPRSIGAAPSAKGERESPATNGAKGTPTRTMDLTRPSNDAVSPR